MLSVVLSVFASANRRFDAPSRENFRKFFFFLRVREPKVRCELSARSYSCIYYFYFLPAAAFPAEYKKDTPEDKIPSHGKPDSYGAKLQDK